VVIRRGDVHWADLGEPIGSAPGYRRPVLVVSADSFNTSCIATVVIVAITSNTDLARAPGNVAVPAGEGGLGRASVVNVSQCATVDKGELGERVGAFGPEVMVQVDAGLSKALDIDRWR